MKVRFVVELVGSLVKEAYASRIAAKAETVLTINCRGEVGRGDVEGVRGVRPCAVGMLVEAVFNH